MSGRCCCDPRQAAGDGDPDADRRGHRHLPADPRAARRSGGLFRRARGKPAGDRRDPQASSASTSRCPSSSSRYVGDLAHGNLGNSLTTGQPVVAEIASRLPASAELTLLGLHPRHRHRDAARHAGRGEAGLLDRPSLPDRRRPPACRCRCSSPACCWSTSSTTCSAGRRRRSAGSTSSPPRRRRITGFYLIDSLLTGNLETFWRALAQLMLPALTLGDLLAGAARAHDARLDAGGAAQRLRPHRARQRPRRRHRHLHLRLPQRHAAGDHTLGMVFSFLLGANVLVEKVFAWPGIGSYAVEALIASDYAPVQGFVLDHGGALRRAEPDDRRPLRRGRSARAAGRMTDISLSPPAASPPKTPSNSIFRHARYVVVGEPGDRLRLRPVRCSSPSAR